MQGKISLTSLQIIILLAWVIKLPGDLIPSCTLYQRVLNRSYVYSEHEIKALCQLNIGVSSKTSNKWTKFCLRNVSCAYKSGFSSHSLPDAACVKRSCKFCFLEGYIALSDSLCRLGVAQYFINSQLLRKLRIGIYGVISFTFFCELQKNP